jgi:hypothetical protein
MNLKKLRTAAGLLTIICLIAFFSCNKKENQPYFKIKIDNIYAPDTVNVLDSVRVHLAGYLGPNQCYEFDNAIFMPNGSDIIVEAYGINTDSGLPCKEGESLLDHDVAVIFEVTGTYTLKAMHEGSVTATRKIVVE